LRIEEQGTHLTLNEHDDDDDDDEYTSHGTTNYHVDLQSAVCHGMLRRLKVVYDKIVSTSTCRTYANPAFVL